MSQSRISIPNILSVASECATRSVGISMDGLEEEIYEARRLAGLKNFNAHKQFLCQQNLLDLMKMLYGEHWDPNREPCFSPDLKGDSPADPNFLKLPLFGLFVKAVFTLPISSAIVEMLFSRCAHAAPPMHGATVTLLLSVGGGAGVGRQLCVRPRQVAFGDEGRHGRQHPAHVGA
jgi:hypothetical protein